MDTFLHKMSIPMVQEAVMISGMPKEVIERIWEEVVDKPSFRWHKEIVRRV